MSNIKAHALTTCVNIQKQIQAFTYTLTQIVCNFNENLIHKDTPVEYWLNIFQKLSLQLQTSLLYTGLLTIRLESIANTDTDTSLKSIAKSDTGISLKRIVNISINIFFYKVLPILSPILLPTLLLTSIHRISTKPTK